MTASNEPTIRSGSVVLSLEKVKTLLDVAVDYDRCPPTSWCVTCRRNLPEYELDEYTDRACLDCWLSYLSE